MKTLLFLALFSTSTFAESYVLNWGINHELDYFKAASVEFKKRIEKKSQGKIKVVVTEIMESQLGYPHLQDVQKSKFQMSQETVFVLEQHAPQLAIWSLPFLFETDKHIEQYINSPDAKKVLDFLSEETGVTAVDYTFSGGFIYFYGMKLTSFSDLKSLTVSLETGSGDYQSFLEKSFNATIVNGEGPGEATEIIAAVGDELYPKAKFGKVHVNVTDHRVISRVLFISKSFLDSLPKDLREILVEESKLMAKKERALSVKGKEIFLKKAKREGLILNQWTRQQKQAGKDLSQALYSSFVKRMGPKPIQEVEKFSR